MTPAQVEAAILLMRSTAKRAREGSKEMHPDHAAYARGEGAGLTEAARMLAEALAESKATAHDDGRKKVRVSSATIAGWPSGYGMSSRAIPEAGPGLWRVAYLEADPDGLTCTLVVLPDPPQGPYVCVVCGGSGPAKHEIVHGDRCGHRRA